MVKSSFKFIVIAACLFLTIITAIAQEPPQVPSGHIDAPASYPVSDYGNIILHVSTVENILLNWTVIDHPLLNGNPNAILFVTPYWFEGAPIVDEHVGVWYDGEKWTIFNQNDEVDMVPNRYFMVQVHSPSESVFQVQAADIIDDIGFILDHPLLNGNPFAEVQITQTWTVNGVNTFQYNESAVAVLHFLGDWHIFNTTPGEIMPEGAGFNVQIVSHASRSFSFVHTTPEPGDSFTTLLDHPLLRGNPFALVLVTNTGFTFGYLSPAYNAANINLTYDGDLNTWMIGTTDFSPIAAETQFMVTVISTVQSENTVSNAGFEMALPSANNQPAGWNTVGNVKRSCNRPTKGKVMAYEQYCAAQVPGGKGLNNALTQNIGDVSQFTAGQTPRFGARIMGRNVSKGVKMLAILTLADETRVKLKIPAAVLQGAYFYKLAYDVGEPLPADVVSARVKISHRGTGSLFVDSVFLSIQELETAFNVSETNTLPLPEPAN